MTDRTLLTPRDFEPYQPPKSTLFVSACLRWFIFALLGADALLFVVAVRGPH